jgi:hypothetical protein
MVVLMMVLVMVMILDDGPGGPVAKLQRSVIEPTAKRSLPSVTVSSSVLSSSPSF